jgi:multidrug efflux pump subunit AcrA (membrane-fusion protein)
LRVFWEAAGDRQGFDLGPVPVYADEAEARRERPPAAAEAGGLAFPLEQQWLIGLCSAAAGPAELVERLRLPARLRLPEGAEALLLAPAAGRLVAEDGAPWPISGQRVAAGQRLLSIEPELLPSDLSQAAALELEIELQRLEAERRLADARLAAEFAERELARQSGLRSEGLSTEPERLAAERDLGRARQELALAEGAARALGGLVDPARRARPLRLPIEAPLAGELLSRGLVPGQTVLAGEPLLEILGPGPLWVEGLLPERELLRISAPPPARVRLPALLGLELEIPAPEEGYLAPEVDPATRCVVLRYGLPAETRLLPGL